MSYDPRRSRPTPKVTPDEESAPIDVLLGPAPESTDDDAPVSPPDAAPSAVRTAEVRPSALLQLAPLIVVAVLAILAWLIRRSRR